MKYEINSITLTDGFKPFSLTLTFETKKEYQHFHNEVMGRLTKTANHAFHGDIFTAGSEGLIDGIKGTIQPPCE